MKTIVLDAEFTGLKVNEDEILQLSIIDEDENILFNEYFKPENKTEWAESEAIHHITPQMVEDKKPITEYKDTIQSIFDGSNTVVGYAMDLDMVFLSAVGITIDEDKIVDVAKDYAEMHNTYHEYFENYKLSKLTEVAEEYNFNYEGMDAHNSLVDCLATLHCYKVVRPEAENKWQAEYDEKCEQIINRYSIDIEEEDIKRLVSEALMINHYLDFEDNVGWQDWMEDMDEEQVDNLMQDIYDDCEELRELIKKLD